MNKNIPTNFNDLWSKDRQLQNKAYYEIIELTDKPVDWAYDVWDKLLENLSHQDNHNRAIAAQLLSNLAKSDPQNKMFTDFNALLAVTRDERFVTARHTMQSLWKIGVVDKQHQKLLLDGLEARFQECISEKNCTLIRYDIIQSLRNVYNVVLDEEVKAKALELIETEEDSKYRKKYATLWKIKKGS